MEKKKKNQQPDAGEEFIIKSLKYRGLACDILPRFQEDFVGSKLDFLHNKNYISSEEYVYGG